MQAVVDRVAWQAQGFGVGAFGKKQALRKSTCPAGLPGTLGALAVRALVKN